MEDHNQKLDILADQITTRYQEMVKEIENDSTLTEAQKDVKRKEIYNNILENMINEMQLDSK